MTATTLDKRHIIDKIILTAHQNGGKPLGKAAFAKVTRIRESEWFGKYWKAWGDALREAGFEPNKLNQPFNQNFILEKLIEFIRELKPPRIPVSGDLRIKARTCPEFPSHTVFEKLGGKAEKAAVLLLYCKGLQGYDDIVQICQPLVGSAELQDRTERVSDSLSFVYMLKCGRYFKIGFTNSTGRREYELQVQLPEKAVLLHKIQTDDPEGIEAYWHRRFQAKRKNGEWFALDSTDVAVFKRRTFM